MKVYLAAPLFTLAEREFNARLARALEDTIDSLQVILPQAVAAELAAGPEFPKKVFESAFAGINKSQLVLAILDGADADSGTCVEIGYARAKQKPVLGIRTDFRASEDRGLNIMAANSCSHLILAPSDSVPFVQLVENIAALLAKIHLKLRD